MEEQATEKQINSLVKLGVPQPWTLTKKEAWAKLNEAWGANGDSKPPVVRPGQFRPHEKPIDGMNVPLKVEQKAPVKEFHLSPEQVNTNALNAAIEAVARDVAPDGSTNLFDLAKEFKEFIENGN